MKIQERTLVLILILSIVFTSFTPLVFAEGDGDEPSPGGLEDLLTTLSQGYGNNASGTGNQSGNQTGDNNQNNSDQKARNQTFPMSEFIGNQTQNQNQSGPGEPGDNPRNNTGENQHQFQYQTQYMNILGEGNHSRIRSRYRNNNTEEIFEIYFNIDNAPILQLSYNSTSTSTNPQYFGLIIEQLIEYIDINANGKYDRNDKIISTIVMSNVTFTNITYVKSITLEGNTIIILETHTLDNLFSIILYVVCEQTVLFNSTITPEEIKIDFNIIRYPYNNQTSQLALLTKIETPFSMTPEQTTYDEQKGRATQESGLGIFSGIHRGFFSWTNRANIDNKSRPVNVTVLTETEQTFTGNTQETISQTQVIFSYPHGEIINHDPKIGVLDILQETILSNLQFEYLSAFYLIACIISAIVFYGVIRFKEKQTIVKK